jgi:hypothetical protein
VATGLSAICSAIETLTILEFDYEGRHRVVHPYCHGVSHKGDESLRAIQIAGESRSRAFGYGKMWVVAKMSNLRLTGLRFEPDDPRYNPDDSALAEVHCRVAARRSEALPAVRAHQPRLALLSPKKR